MEDQYERLQKVREKFLWNIAIKYKLALYNIKDTEKVCKMSCKFYDGKEDKCKKANSPCAVFFNDCDYNKIFIHLINETAKRRIQNKKEIRVFKEHIWNKIAKKYNLKPGKVRNIAGYIENRCIYHYDKYCTQTKDQMKICFVFNKGCICYEKFISEIKSDSSKIIANTTPSKEIQQPSKPKLHKIGVKDFIIRGNVFRCMHKLHQIQNVDAEVKVSLNNGEDKLFQISAGYCQQCNVYFIMESTYQELKRKGIILCRVTDSKTYAKGGFMNGSKLAQESILMQYGYNVSQTVGLSARQRQKILAVMIDNKVLSKSEIISYLDFFIRQHGSRNNMGVAISKWEDDREFVEHYRSGEYTKFGVNAIYRR